MTLLEEKYQQLMTQMAQNPDRSHVIVQMLSILEIGRKYPILVPSYHFYEDSFSSRLKEWKDSKGKSTRELEKEVQQSLFD